jgi:hypothetical protein
MFSNLSSGILFRLIWGVKCSYKMKMIKCFVLLVLAGLTGLSDATTFNGLVRYHNMKRMDHGAAPLRWDKTAARFAKKNACGCEFQHSKGAQAYGGTSTLLSVRKETTLFSL